MSDTPPTDLHILLMTAYPPGDGIAVPYERWEVTVEATGEVILGGPMPVDQEAVREACDAYHKRITENAQALVQRPLPLPITDEKAVAAITHFLLMGNGTYPSPEEMAAGLLRRLAFEGYVVTKADLDSA
jgi:hypothetical protein